MKLFANNATSTLLAPISAVALSLQVASGDGARFPSPGADWFYVTLCVVTNGVEGSIEIVKVTVRTGDVFTIVRAQEGTSPLAYTTGDRVSLRVTAEAVNAFEAHGASIANPHSVTKTQVGLGNADNTSDVNKPVSTAQTAAFAAKGANSDITSLSGLTTALSIAQGGTAGTTPAAARAALGAVAATDIKQLQSVDYTLSANALTLKLNPTNLDFRSTTLDSGAPVNVANAAQLTTTISSGSTAGTVSAVQSDIILLAINNAGTMELAWTNLAGGLDLSEQGVITTVAEGGAGAADSANVIYSTTARTGVAYRVVGLFRSTQTTAGTWTQTPTLVQPMGGQALAAMASLGYGAVSRPTRALGTTYYNTSGKPREVVATIAGASGATASTFSYTRGAFTSPAIQASESNSTAWNSLSFTISLIVPPGWGYSFQNVTGTNTIQQWEES